MAVVIYTDGCCLRNGCPDSQAGYGIYFKKGSFQDEYGPLPSPPRTNQRAELYAVLRALEIVQNSTQPIIIRTDSEYTIGCVTEWLPAWEQNGYQTASGGKPKNLDLIIPIRDFIEELSVKFEYVEGHSGDEGNEIADEFAHKGAAMD